VVGLALTSSQSPTQLLIPFLTSPPQQDKGRKEEKWERESLWVKIKTGRLLTNYCCRQNRLELGKLIYCQQSLLIWVVRKKNKKKKNEHLHT